MSATTTAEAARPWVRERGLEFLRQELLEDRPSTNHHISPHRHFVA
jgi:hypothetical protein